VFVTVRADFNANFGISQFLVTDFQANLLQSLLLILLCNIVLIWFFWSCYGDTIYSNFIKSSTLIEIEALRKSVERLKLPREHTPRI
jgi:hypothetical protein